MRCRMAGDADFDREAITEERTYIHIAHVVKFISLCQQYYSALWAVGCWLSCK